jgi:hypothetical protein
VRSAGVAAGLCLLALRAGQTVSAHSFHASLAQIEHNRETGKAEIAIRLFVDDFEEALARRQGAPVRLDKAPDAERIVLAYLGGTLVLTGRDGRKAPLAWVGMDVQALTVWIYLEAELKSGLAGGRLRNTVLFELFDDQVNTVNFRQGKARATLVFDPGDDETQRIDGLAEPTAER